MENIAFNHGLMIEKLRHHLSNEDIIKHLKEGNPGRFDIYGDGLPDWNTFVSYYNANSQKLENAIQEGYKISFLTKGTLKTMMRIKFGLLEDEHYSDQGTILNGFTLSHEVLSELKQMVSNNWVFKIETAVGNEVSFAIELK